MIPTPAMYECTLVHQRREGVHYRFKHTLRMWLVDVDDIPRPRVPLRWLWSFCSDDHLGDPELPIGDNIREFLRLHDAESPGGRILMLAQARTLGYVFDPVSIFWCYDRSGELKHVVAETRNTFGERHCYLMGPDEAGRAVTAKHLYVSPLFSVDGRYSMCFTLDADRVLVTMTLLRPDGPRADTEHTALVATLRGNRRPAGQWTMLRSPLCSRLVTVRIHYHAFKLRRRGINPRRRRIHAPQPGVDRPPERTASERIRPADTPRTPGDP